MVLLGTSYIDESRQQTCRNHLPMTTRMEDQMPHSYSSLGASRQICARPKYCGKTPFALIPCLLEGL